MVSSPTSLLKQRLLAFWGKFLRVVLPYITQICATMFFSFFHYSLATSISNRVQISTDYSYFMHVFCDTRKRKDLSLTITKSFQCLKKISGLKPFRAWKHTKCVQQGCYFFHVIFLSLFSCSFDDQSWFFFLQIFYFIQ